MGSKQTTTQTNQYNPASMGAFNTLTPQAQGVLSGYMTNPFGNPFYNLALQSGLKANQQMNQGQMSNLTRNFAASGFGGNMPGFQASQLQRAGYNASALNSNTFLQNAMNAQNLQMQATNMGLNYKPLQTGSTQVQQTTGLGTWLPQVVGMGLSAAMAPLSGGTSLMGKLGARLGMAGAGMGSSLLSNLTKPAMSSGYSYGGYNPSLSFLQTPSAMPGMGFNPFMMGYNQPSQNPFGGF